MFEKPQNIFLYTPDFVDSVTKSFYAAHNFVAVHTGKQNIYSRLPNFAVESKKCLIDGFFPFKLGCSSKETIRISLMAIVLAVLFAKMCFNVLL